jgi:putative transposase
VHTARRDKASIIGGIAWQPSTGKVDILAHMYPGANIESERTVEFLEGLHEIICGDVVLIWDNITTHHSQSVQKFLAANSDWLTVVNLPSYSPDLNPIEYLWSAWKRTYLANLCKSNSSVICDVLIENEAAASDSTLLKGCILASGLVHKTEMLT